MESEPKIILKIEEDNSPQDDSNRGIAISGISRELISSLFRQPGFSEKLTRYFDAEIVALATAKLTTATAELAEIKLAVMVVGTADDLGVDRIELARRPDALKL